MAPGGFSVSNLAKDLTVYSRMTSAVKKLAFLSQQPS